MQGLSSKTVEWLKSLGVEQVSNTEIQSGRIVGKAIRAVNPNCNLQLHESSTAVSRANNWNNLILQLKEVGITVSQDDKTDIVNGNHELVYRILDKLQDLAEKSQTQKQIEVDLSKINPKSNLADSSSLLELFILVIMKHFHLNPKQAVALLSSQCKYLTHILVKGLKGDCKPVEALINELIKYIDNINRFCKNKENQIFFIKAIKPALISKSQVAAARSILLLSQFLHPLPNRFEIIKQHFVTTVLLAIRRHPSMISTILQFLMKMTDFSKDTYILLKSETTFEQMKQILSIIFAICKEKGDLNIFYSLKGLNQFLNKIVQGVKNLEGLLTSMDFILLIIKDKTKLICDGDRGAKLIKYIQESILVKKNDRIVFAQQLFGLLEIFGKDKNHLAPSIFKILVIKYQNLIDSEQSKLYIENFSQIVTEFPTIPYSLIVEVLNLRLQNNTIALTQLELHFLRQVSVNSSLDTKTGLSVYNIVSKILIQLPALSFLCGEILIFIVRKLVQEDLVIDLSLKLVKVCLAIHFANTKRVVARRKSITGINKNDLEDAIQKSKSICIENFIYRLTKENVEEINRQSEPLICYSYIQVHNLSKESSLGLQKIVKLFGEQSEVLNKYQLEAKKLDDEQQKKQNSQKSKIKESSWGHGRYNESPGSIKHRSSSNHRSEDTLKSKSSKLDPLLLSSSGVTSTALKGLEKYHKSYLSKIQRVQQEESKKKEQEDRQSYLRNVFQRKLLDKGIDVKKDKDQYFQHLYEFGVKEKQMSQDFVKNIVELPLYISEEEEDRDSKALEYVLKKYQRILKLYYHIYSGHIKPESLGSFDQISQKINLLYSANLWKMLKDHALNEFISFRQVQYLSKRINQLLGKKFEDPTALDYQGFQTFITQSSFSMFTRPPQNLTGRPVSQMVQETISRFKLYASDNKINQSLFEDPDNVFYNETEAIKELNKKLESNSDYILPQGYKKMTQKKILFSHAINIDSIDQTYKDGLQIVDWILSKALKIHVIEPFSTFETICKARPTLYYKQRNQGEVHSEKISSFMKKELARMPIKDREIGKQAAMVIAQIITAVQFGHDRTGQKHENKAVKQKKQQQQEKARKESSQNKKWSERNREIKSAIVKHKQGLGQKEKDQAEKKREQKNKKEEEIKKREEELLKMKSKVENYQIQKKENEEKQKKDKQDAKRREKQTFEKKKKEIQNSKRKVEESKQIKQEELKQKNKDEKAQQKQRKATELKKFETQQRKRKQLLQQYKNRKIQASGLQESSIGLKIGEKIKQKLNKVVDSNLQQQQDSSKEID